MVISETLQVTLELSEILKGLGLQHLVGGSIASSIHGIPRATQDVDLLVRISKKHIKPLLKALGEDYYADENAILDAVQCKSTFNLIHMGSMLKIDVFVYKDDELLAFEMERASEILVAENPPRTLCVADAADIVIQKLLWYEQGGRVSERQWLDVIGVLKVKKDDLDLKYIEKWATSRGVMDLLTKALLEAGWSR